MFFSEYHAVRISTDQNNSGYGQVSVGDTEFHILPWGESLAIYKGPPTVI